MRLAKRKRGIAVDSRVRRAIRQEPDLRTTEAIANRRNAGERPSVEHPMCDAQVAVYDVDIK